MRVSAAFAIGTLSLCFSLTACDTPPAAAPGTAQSETYTGSHINGVVDPSLTGSNNQHWLEKQLRNTSFN